VCVCVCVCVWNREKDIVWVSVCVSVKDREKLKERVWETYVHRITKLFLGREERR